MTAQAPDRFTYRHKEYSLAGINGTGLFNPDEHEMKLRSPNTACWRGFEAHYAIRDEQLRMIGLKICAHDMDTLPLLLYGSPLQLFSDAQQQVDHEFFDGMYQDCPDAVPFTGGILLGSGFIQELYVHMGYHPAWKFHEVHELVFQKGSLVKETNCSEQMEEFRQRFNPEHQSIEDAEEIKAWIARCFDLGYEGWADF